jgi:hypothetical protein
VAGGDGTNGHGTTSQGLLGTLISLLVAERSGFQPGDSTGLSSLTEFAERMTRESMDSLEHAAVTTVVPKGPATPATTA